MEEEEEESEKEDGGFHLSSLMADFEWEILYEWKRLVYRGDVIMNRRRRRRRRRKQGCH